MTVGPDGNPYGPEGGAIHMMNEVQERDHVDMLKYRLHDRDPNRRFKAAVAMASYVADQMYLPEEMDLHPAAVLSEIIMKPKTHKTAVIDCARAFAIMGDYAADYGKEALGLLVNAGDPDMRFEVIRAIQRLGPSTADKTAEALAIAVVDHGEMGSPFLRYQAGLALEILGRSAAPAAGASLAKALRDEDTDVRNQACKCLKVMGDAAAEAAVPGLIEVVNKGGFEQRRLAIEALKAMGEAAAMAHEELGKKLRPLPGQDFCIRQLAAEALGAMGNDVVRQPDRQRDLARALGDPREEVRSAARDALRGAGCMRALNGSMALFDPIEGVHWPPERTAAPPPAPPPAAAPPRVARVPEVTPEAAPPAAAEEEASDESDESEAFSEGTASEDEEAQSEASEARMPAVAGERPPASPKTFGKFVAEASERPAEVPVSASEARRRRDQVRVESERALMRLGQKADADEGSESGPG